MEGSKGGEVGMEGGREVKGEGGSRVEGGPRLAQIDPRLVASCANALGNYYIKNQS